MADYRQSDEYFRYSYKKGWNIVMTGKTRMLIKNVPLLGSLIKIQRGPSDITPEEIDNTAKQYKAKAVVIEPDINTDNPKYDETENILNKNGFKDINLFLSPTKTSYIDLQKNEGEILASFDQDIRKNISNNNNKNITYREPKSIEEIYKLINKAGHRQDYFVQNLRDWKRQWEPFGERIKVCFAYLEEGLLGGNMMLIEPPVTYGLYLPVTDLGKTHHIAGTLIWEGIKLSKKAGAAIFDLNGLYDDRYGYPMRWKGLSAFKKKFRGHEIQFMHPKAKVYSQVLKPFEKMGLLWIFFI